MKRLSLLLVLSALIALSHVSCGGGGGSSGGNQLPSIALKTSSYRIVQPTDSWTYSISGTLNQGGPNYPFTGTASDIITTTTIMSPINNTQCKIDAASVNMTVNNNIQISSNAFNYFTQDGSGNQYTYGEETVLQISG